MAYAEGVSRVPGDEAKCAAALTLIERMSDETFVLPLQGVAELHNVLVRKAGVSPAEAATRAQLWCDRSILVPTDTAVFDAALGATAAHNLQIFDAIILAAAAHEKCELLLSEDMHEGFVWRGVTVTNPFGPSPDPRLRRLLEGQG